MVTKLHRHIDIDGNELPPTYDEIPEEELAQEEEDRTCGEYLARSSNVITQPEIWYLLRAFGKKLGYKVD